MISEIIKEIGMEELWLNIQAQRDDTIIWFCLWWPVQSTISSIVIECVAKSLKKVNSDD